MTGSAHVPVRFSRTSHLVELLDEAKELSGILASARPEAATVTARRDEAIVASLQLDGSPLSELPTADELARGDGTIVDPGSIAGLSRSSSWYASFDALSEPGDEALLLWEARGMIAGFASDDLAPMLGTDPLEALAELHRRLVVNLIAPDRAGRPRELPQAVHDAAVGRILYFTTEPERIEQELDELAAWVAGPGRVAHGLLTAGVLHLELLRIHPFDAANGRLARMAARLVLRANGLDPHGLGAPETVLARDPLGYHTEVAQTLRRRDASLWLERWSDAVVGGLRSAAQTLGLLDADPAPADLALLDALPDGALTLADLREHTSGDLEEARRKARSLLDAGRIERVPGSRGLRFTRR